MLHKLYIRMQRSIQFKILIIFSVSLLVVHISIWLLLSQLLFKAIDKNQQGYLKDYAQKITKDIRDSQSDYENLVVQLACNHEIAVGVSRKYDDYISVWEAMHLIKSMMCTDNLLVHHVQKLQIVQDGDIGADGETFIQLGEDDKIPQNLEWFERVEENRKYLCVANEVEGVFNGVKAYIRLSIDAQKAFGTSMNTEDSQWKFYLINKEGNVLASSEAEAVECNLEKYLGQSINYDEDSIFKLKEKKCIAIQYPVNEEWKVVVTLPKDEYGNKIKMAKQWAFLIMAVYLVGMGLILNIILKRMFTRINKIGKRIENVMVTEDNIIDVNGCDEISKLELQYNLMLKNLDNTISELANVRNQKQLIEIKSLESYINPHFLYNTLGVIRWEALENGSDKICNMVDKLSAFYRLSLNKGKGTLTVRNEIELAKAYLYIQEERCDHVVDINIEADEQLLEVQIPKMILQPLLENIFLHGNIVEEGRRKINIKFQQAQGKMHIEVQDNGQGIDKETVAKLNIRSAEFASKQGVGISFLHEVLRIYYGEAAKLKVTSVLGEGTSVQIELPL